MSLSIKASLLSILLLILSACGGDGDGGNSTNTATLSDFVGVWEWFDDYGTGNIDEYYVYVDAEGNWTEYDYDGDEYDQGANCYYIYPRGFLVSVGDGIINHSFYGDFSATISGNTVTVNGLGGSPTQTFVKSSLEVSDLSPDCLEALSN